MSEMGDAIMGTGVGHGDNMGIDAANAAINSPLLENVCITGARGVLVNVTGGKEMSLHEVSAATSVVYDAAGSDANIIFGAVIDPSLKDELRVTVIATGFGTPPEYVEDWEQSDGDLFTTSRPGSVMRSHESSGHAPVHEREGVVVRSHGTPEEQVVHSGGEDLEIPAFIRKQNGQL